MYTTQIQVFILKLQEFVHFNKQTMQLQIFIFILTAENVQMCKLLSSVEEQLKKIKVRSVSAVAGGYSNGCREFH